MSGKATSHKETGDGRHLTWREHGLLILEDTVVSVVIAWVFYDSVLGLAIVIPLAVLNHRRYRQSIQEKWEKKFSVQLRDLLSELVSALKIGYSVERAFAEVEKSLGDLYGSDCVFAESLFELNQKVKMRIPVEQAFLEMADHYANEDLSGFAEVFRFAKRLGGNYIENIKRCASKVSSRLEIASEISLAVAEKQMELKVMMAMPLGVLLYMKVSSPDFLDSVYHSFFGVAMMTGALAVYAGAIILGKRIVDIKV